MNTWAMPRGQSFKQLATYFTLAYLVSWVIWLPLYGPALGINGLPVLPYHHALGGLGPLLAAFFTTYVYGGKQGVVALLKKSMRARPLVYLLVALLSPFLLVLVAALIQTLVSGTPFDINGLWGTKEFPGFNLPEFFLYNLVFFGFGEEAGWRGFALPRFQQRFNALTACLLLTLFWALWHWPLFLYRPGYTAMGVAGIFGWLMSLLTGSVLLTWLYNASKGSVLVCAVFHSTIDIAFTGDMASGEVAGYMGFLITLWGMVTIFVFRPAHLANIPRQQENIVRD